MYKSVIVVLIICDNEIPVIFNMFKSMKKFFLFITYQSL